MNVYHQRVENVVSNEFVYEIDDFFSSIFNFRINDFHLQIKINNRNSDPSTYFKDLFKIRFIFKRNFHINIKV